MTVRAFLGVVVRRVACVTCHRRTGRVTYFDPHQVLWVENAATIPAHALAALPADEQARVRRHLARFNVFV